MRRRIDRVVAVAVLTSGIVGAAAAAEREPALWTSAPRHKPAISASAFADLAERARAAVVHVRGEVTEGSVSDADTETSRTSIGTGFIIHRDGYVVTNEHVIRGVSDLHIRLYDGRELHGLRRGRRPRHRHRAAQDQAQGDAAGAAARGFGRRARGRAGDRDRQPASGSTTASPPGIVSAKERVVDRSTLREPHAAGHLFVLHPDRRVDQPGQLGRAAHRRGRRRHRRQRRVLGRPSAAAGAGHRLRDPDQHGQGAAAAAGARRQRAAVVPGRRRAADRRGAGGGAAADVGARRADRQRREGIAGRGGRAGAGRRRAVAGTAPRSSPART